jgi:hypothetical protein
MWGRCQTVGNGTGRVEYGIHVGRLTVYFRSLGTCISIELRDFVRFEEIVHGIQSCCCTHEFVQVWFEPCHAFELVQCSVAGTYIAVAHVESSGLLKVYPSLLLAKWLTLLLYMVTSSSTVPTAGWLKRAMWFLMKLLSTS